MFEGDQLIAKVPLSWKKRFSHGVIIPHKMRNCDNCAKDILYDGCDQLVNQNKEISGNQNHLKRRVSNKFRHMLPKYKTN